MSATFTENLAVLICLLANLKKCHKAREESFNFLPIYGTRNQSEGFFSNRKEYRLEIFMECVAEIEHSLKKTLTKSILFLLFVYYGKN